MHQQSCLRLTRVLVAPTFVLALASCGGDSTSPPAPSALVRVAGHDVSAAAGSATDAPPTVQVNDSRGNPVKGVVVNFAVSVGDGSIDATVDTSDAQGRASAARWTLGSTFGPNIVTATSASIAGASAQFSATGLAPTAIVVTEGDGLRATVGSMTSDAPSVKVTMVDGRPFPNAAVTFEVIDGGGAIGMRIATTNTQGVATARSWRLGGRAGQQRLRASVRAMNGPLATTFSATATTSGVAAVVKVAGDNQVGGAGTMAGTPPRVRVTDGYGNGIADVAVTFVATAGGGTVTGSTATTNAAGEASPASWTLGSASGINTLRASVGALSSEFAATGIGAGDGYISLLAGGDQVARVGSTATPISLRVQSSTGASMSDVPVTFAIKTGGGTLATTTVTSAPGGGVTLSGWTLGGTAGTQEITASAPGVAPLLIRARAYPASSFDVVLRFLDTPTARQRQAFENATARWRQLVIGDLQDIQIPEGAVPANSCGAGTPAIAELVDDIVILVRLASIDGVDGVLGSAGPCIVTTTGPRTVVGVMQFDVADLGALENAGELDAVILHEMGHVFGIGTFWNARTLVQNRGGADPYYTGRDATAGFAASGGLAYAGNPVPADNTSGSDAAGTRDVHWRESTFDRELMTGYFNSGATNPLSIVSVGTLADLGYQVSYAAADPYVVPPPMSGLMKGLGLAAPRRIVEAEPAFEPRVWDAASRTAVPLSKWTRGFTRPNVSNPKPTPPAPPGPRDSRTP